jgi:hypothetical protein
MPGERKNLSELISTAGRRLSRALPGLIGLLGLGRVTRVTGRGRGRRPGRRAEVKEKRCDDMDMDSVTAMSSLPIRVDT